jgi:hypothetical protein
MRNDDPVAIDRRPPAGRSILWWIVPLLSLLLIGIGLLYYFMIYKNNQPASTAQTSNATPSTQSLQTQTTPAATVTDLATLLSSDSGSLIGKKVSLSSAIVDQVIGDKSFTLGSPTDHIYALLSDRLNSGQTEQTVQIQAGEARSIEGAVIKAPSDMTDLISQLQLSEEQADELKNQGFYISVNQTSAVNNSDGGGTMPTGAGTE